LKSESDVGTLRSVLLKRPEEAFVSQRAVDGQWESLHYTARPVFEDAIREHDRFSALLEGLGIEVHYLPRNDSVGLDSVYVRDASIVCDQGVVVCRMGKDVRGTEPEVQQAFFRELGWPIAGAIHAEGRLEGGDVVWVGPRTLAVGLGYRTNEEGIRQLGEILGDSIDELLIVPLPHWRGEDDVFHLMSIFSPLDLDLALVYSPLLPVPFRAALIAIGLELIEVPDAEYDTMACNVLAVAPRRCIALAGNPETRRRLEAAGVTVHEYAGDEISVKGAGGPTCLTRPLVRDPA
jgi:N-dimethylarginine dimethylaminohydrolase